MQPMEPMKLLKPTQSQKSFNSSKRLGGFKG